MLTKYKKIFFEFLSIGTPRAIVFDIALAFFVLAMIPTSLWDNSQSLCIWKRFVLPLIYRGHCPTSGVFLGCNCPACGLTRGMSHLLHGEPLVAYGFNKLIFLVFGFVVLIFLINLRKIILKKNS